MKQKRPLSRSRSARVHCAVAVARSAHARSAALADQGMIGDDRLPDVTPKKPKTQERSRANKRDKERAENANSQTNYPKPCHLVKSAFLLVSRVHPFGGKLYPAGLAAARRSFNWRTPFPASVKKRKVWQPCYEDGRGFCRLSLDRVQKSVPLCRTRPRRLKLR